MLAQVSAVFKATYARELPCEQEHRFTEIWRTTRLLKMVTGNVTRDRLSTGELFVAALKRTSPLIEALPPKTAPIFQRFSVTVLVIRELAAGCHFTCTTVDKMEQCATQARLCTLLFTEIPHFCTMACPLNQTSSRKKKKKHTVILYRRPRWPCSQWNLTIDRKCA